MSKMGSHEPFEHMQHKLRQKERSGIDLTLMCADGMWQTIGKFLMRATTLLQTSSQLEVWAKNYNPAKLESPNRGNFGTPPWESRDKKPFECRCRGEAQRILYGGRWWFPPNLGCGEFCEFKVARGLS